MAFITTGWELVALPLNCAESYGSTKGEDFAEAIDGIVTRHNLTGRAVARTTHCEPLVVKGVAFFWNGSLHAHWLLHSPTGEHYGHHLRWAWFEEDNGVGSRGGDRVLDVKPSGG